MLNVALKQPFGQRSASRLHAWPYSFYTVTSGSPGSVGCVFFFLFVFVVPRCDVIQGIFLGGGRVRICACAHLCECVAASDTEFLFRDCFEGSASDVSLRKTCLLCMTPVGGKDEGKSAGEGCGGEGVHWGCPN